MIGKSMMAFEIHSQMFEIQGWFKLIILIFCLEVVSGNKSAKFIYYSDDNGLSHQGAEINSSKYYCAVAEVTISIITIVWCFL